MYLLLFSACFFVVKSDDIPTTTKIYEIESPNQSDTIRIVEGESLWTQTENPTKFQHRSFNNNPNNNNAYLDENYSSLASEEDEVDAPGAALKKFLTTYSENLKKKVEDKDQQTPTNLFVTKTPTSVGNSEEKSIKWDLLHFQKHHHPYDDKKGWVSMEPIPWSISKISKWENNQKIQQQPQQQYYQQQQRPSWENSYDSNDRLWDSTESYHHKKPFRPYESSSSNKYYTNDKTTIINNDYDYYSDMENKPNDHRPSFQRPSAFYNQKVHLKKPSHYKHDEANCKDHQHHHHHHHSSLGDILTDGQPPNFPQPHYESNNRRRGTDIHPDTHPFTGDGDWVLLSTTKGYKYPQQRQRSLQLSPDSVGAHRSVRLTVLPPTKNSKINMTTSHGGLLQVESTFETVEQAKNQYLKKLKLKKQRPNKNKVVNKKNKLSAKPVIAPTTVTTMKRNTEADPSAVLAAVGAGMIPATMAMLVPIAMNGKKRRKRDATKFVTSNPYSSVEITLPRYL